MKPLKGRATLVQLKAHKARLDMQVAAESNTKQEHAVSECRKATGKSTIDELAETRGAQTTGVD